jgi:transcription initiation factor TFIIIB Brf1 subunit/transcription initiation factor TFIIB
MPNDKDKIQKRYSEILELLQAFCKAKLNDEYLELAEKMLGKLARKRHVPFETGKVEIWAAAIIHALGMVNFLFDRSQNPHTTVREIHEFFGTKESTVGNKSKEIRDMFKLRHWDDEFGTREMQKRNPFNSMRVLPNGMIVFIEEE